MIIQQNDRTWSQNEDLRFRLVNKSINWSSHDVNEADGTVEANSTRYCDASLNTIENKISSNIVQTLPTISNQDHAIEMQMIQSI